MPRIPNNLREGAIGILDADMWTEHVARHGGCSSRAIQRVTTRGQDRYIMNRHLRNRFQTATANTPGLHNNRCSVRSVYTLVGYGDAGIPFFFLMNQDFLYNVVMAGCACTMGILSWSGQPLPMVIVHY